MKNISIYLHVSGYTCRGCQVGGEEIFVFFQEEIEQVKDFV